MITKAKRLAMRHWAFGVWCLVIGLIVGLSGVMIVGRTVPTTQWIVFGGNTDTGDGNGNGMLKTQFVQLGWASESQIFQVTYPADVSKMEASTQAAMGPGEAAYADLCGSRTCIIAGFSQGSDPAIELGKRVGHPSTSTYLFGAPQPSTGIWHHFAPDHPWVEPFLQQAGLPTNRVPLPGTKNFYDQDDPYADLAPQCLNGGAVFFQTSGISEFHKVMPPNGGEVWVGPDGVENHEFNAARWPISVSGQVGQMFGCPDQGWFTFPPDPKAFNPQMPPMPFTPGG